MTSRRGFSLVEMIIVLVLAGIVSTAAFSMFTTQNRLNAAMTALGESQESARSAVQVAASELRSASSGSVISASSDRLVVRVPIVVGVICGEGASNHVGVYFPMDGRVIDLRTEADGKMLLNANVGWQRRSFAGTDGFLGASSRQICADAGNGTAGDDGDYATLLGRDPVGTPIMIYRDVTYSFATSALDPSRRGFFRTAHREEVELAQGFSSRTGLEYMVSNDGVWRTSVANNRLDDISAVRVLAEVSGVASSGSSTGNATFSLVREIQLRNAE
jgi:prepilin-type N-terminal cleavage/methylation domain-containing protein